MGTIAGNIGIIPSRKLVVENKNGKFLNSTGRTMVLYQQAQSNLDKAQREYTGLVTQIDEKKANLNAYKALYQQYYDPIKVGDFNVAIGKLITEEKFGHGNSQKWASRVGDLHYKFTNTAKIIPREWDDQGDRWTIHGMGVAGNDPWRAAQIELVKYWADEVYAKDVKATENVIKSLEDALLAKSKEIETLTKERDKALAAEEKASNQRIKEKETDPEYLKAKAESERMLGEIELRKKRSRNILILGAFGLGLAGLIVYTMRKK